MREEEDGERQTHPLEGHILSLTTFHGIKNTKRELEKRSLDTFFH